MMDPIKFNNFPKTIKLIALMGMGVLGLLICRGFHLVPSSDYDNILLYLSIVTLLTCGYEGHKALKKMEASLEKLEEKK